jgi:hypothetical protein
MAKKKKVSGASSSPFFAGVKTYFWVIVIGWVVFTWFDEDNADPVSPPPKTSTRPVRGKVPSPSNRPRPVSTTTAPQPEPPQPVVESAVDFTPYSRTGNEIFPSHLLSIKTSSASGYRKPAGMAPSYGVEGSLGVIVRNVRRGETYKVTITGDQFIKASEETYAINENAPVAVMHPRLNYDYPALRRNTQTTFTNVTFSVSKGAQEPGTVKTQKWQIHQINDCPLWLTVRTIQADGSFSSEVVSYESVIAGYVNENHPWIDAILREAKETGICTQFIGYQGGEEQIWPQVSAIWTALQRRGLSYSSISTTTKSEGHSFQHVRFFDQSISASQANCLDGSVLLCSILRKIGLNTGIMLVPGHAYVCIVDKTNKSYFCGIETTAIGSHDLRRAVSIANNEGEYPLSKFNDKYTFIDITDVRARHRNPIAFDEIAAIPSARPQTYYQAFPSREELARQERIILANKLKVRMTELLANLRLRNSDEFRLSAVTLFTEIRRCQRAFNGIRNLPILEKSGIIEADQRMEDRYAQIIELLKTRAIPAGSEITDGDLTIAKEITDALVSLASMPLTY